jgi:hypothetical protein
LWKNYKETLPNLCYTLDNPYLVVFAMGNSRVPSCQREFSSIGNGKVVVGLAANRQLGGYPNQLPQALGTYFYGLTDIFSSIKHANVRHKPNLCKILLDFSGLLSLLVLGLGGRQWQT